MAGLLLVFSHPGPTLSEREYHSWYDEEHVPLRTCIPGFNSAVRLVASDGQHPNWGAIYDLDGIEVLRSEEYKYALAARSDREISVLQRLRPLERRVYQGIGSKTSGLLESGRVQAKFFIFVSMTPSIESEADFNAWYNEEHVPMLMRVPGWLRTRRYILTEQSGVPLRPPKYLAMHEFSESRDFNSGEYKAAVDTPWRTRIMDQIQERERREFTIWKKFK